MFESIGTVQYKNKTVYDITKFAFIFDKIQNKYTIPIWVNYEIKINEQPEHIAYNFYGDCEAVWCIYILNKMMHCFYGWPLSTSELEEYTIDTYGIENINSPHHWVDKTTGIEYSTIHSNCKVISNYAYEYLENEKRRNIKIIRPELYEEIKNLYDKLMTTPDLYTIGRLI